MNLPDGVTLELLALMDQMLDETIPAEGVRVLETALRGRPEAQAFFRRYCQLHVDLDMATRVQRAIDAFRSQDLMSMAAVPSCAVAEDDAAARRRARQTELRRRKAWWRRPAVWAAVLLVGIGAGAAYHTLTRRAQMAGQPVKRSGDEILVHLDTTERHTLTLSDGGSLVVQGPADLDLVGSSLARLRRGRIRVRVATGGSKSFVVETPRGTVTDRGTEFGVNVAQDTSTGVVVFEGRVDLAVPVAQGTAAAHVESLIQGQGVNVGEAGDLRRIMSIVAGQGKTYRQCGEAGGDEEGGLIAEVWDNNRLPECRQFYEIVPHGLAEDAVAYVDRPGYEWNGVDVKGMPAYLLGADYVKTFNDDKMRPDMEVCVRLRRPAKLYLFMDKRVAVPEWLSRDFQDTGDPMGCDHAPFMENGVKRATMYGHGEGPGKSIDARCSIWVRTVASPGVVKLGPNQGADRNSDMYGIAAVALGTTASTDSRPAEKD